MTRHSVNNNTRMGLVISFCSNSNHLISLIPAKLPQISGYVHTVPDSETERRRKCTG